MEAKSVTAGRFRRAGDVRSLGVIGFFALRRSSPGHRLPTVVDVGQTALRAEEGRVVSHSRS